MCRGNGIAGQSFRMQAVRVEQRMPTRSGRLRRATILSDSADCRHSEKNPREPLIFRFSRPEGRRCLGRAGSLQGPEGKAKDAVHDLVHLMSGPPAPARRAGFGGNRRTPPVLQTSHPADFYLPLAAARSLIG